MSKPSRNIKSLRERKKQMKMVQETQNSHNEKKIQITQEQLDVIVIDLTLRELFNNGDKVIIDFRKDVIEKYSIPGNEHAVERFWDILDATQLVNPVVGFGNSHKLSLNSQGYNLMLQYGNYQNYVNTMMAAQQPQIQEAPQVEQKAEPETSTSQNNQNLETEVEKTKKKRDDKTF